MKSIKNIFLVLLIMLQFNSCKQPDNIPVINFDENVEAVGIAKNLNNDAESIDFCKIINIDWDLIWIIPPYASSDQISKIEAKNFSAIKNKVEVTKNGEQHVQLVIVNRDRVVAYGELNRRPLDLAQLVKPDGELVSISKENCAHFIAAYNKLDSLSWKVIVKNLK